MNGGEQLGRRLSFLDVGTEEEGEENNNNNNDNNNNNNNNNPVTSCVHVIELFGSIEGGAFLSLEKRQITSSALLCYVEFEPVIPVSKRGTESHVLLISGTFRAC
jgi:hypothetical protein